MIIWVLNHDELYLVSMAICSSRSFHSSVDRASVVDKSIAAGLSPTSPSQEGEAGIAGRRLSLYISQLFRVR
jgi:hypothetical protein